MLAEQGRHFDVVIVDPPAFIQRKKDIKQGMKAYQRINEAALKLIGDGGTLVSASCSMHLSAADLCTVVNNAAQRVGGVSANFGARSPGYGSSDPSCNS